MKKVRILHIITHLAVGGAQDNTLITVERLNREQYDVSLLSSPSGGWIERARMIPKLRLLFLDELIRKIHPIYDIIAVVKIYGLIRRGKYAIVHTHSSKPGFSGRIAARLAGVPVVVHTIHGFPFHSEMPGLVYRFFVIIERFLSQYTDVLVTVSRRNQATAIRLGIAPAAKFVNIYSGIPFERFEGPFRNQALRKELGIRPDEVIVGMVGRLSRQKAPDVFVRAIPEVLRNHPNARFIIAGDGELRGRVIRLAQQLCVRENFLLLGNRDDVPDILSLLDIFVLTSLWEGLGRSLTEAMYLARPVVATRVNGVPELVIDGKTGFLIPTKDPQATADAICRLLDRPDDARRMGQAAKLRVENDFNAARMVRDIEMLYDTQLQQACMRAMQRHVKNC